MSEKNEIEAIDLGRAETEKYEPSDEVKEEFEAAARVGSGSDELIEKLREHHSASPALSGGDIDASWEDSNAVGEESVGGENPTPDQDVVEELGEAVGLTYQDNEPLGGENKLHKRDENRWELNPASADEE